MESKRTIFHVSFELSGEKKETDCVHLISNKHVKGFNIVISSGKLYYLRFFILSFLHRKVSDRPSVDRTNARFE